MCGIFGYIGKKDNASQIVFDGLKLLEYRGYDSWGIAAKSQNNELRIKNLGGQTSFQIEKHIGKIGDKTLNSNFSNQNSNLAIGHTRWATHGGVTVDNAHPHSDCQKELVVIHNGIVENFSELKEYLIKKKHTFVSETDTEVIAHLIEEELKKNNNFEDAVKTAFGRLAGLNAIVVADSKSSKIIAAKVGSPLVIGVNEDGFYVASDTSGILKHTKKVLFLEDNQMIVLDNKLKLFQLPEKKEIKPVFNTINWKFEDAEKGKYKHFFLKEIFEQPTIINNIALNYKEETQKLANLIKKSYGAFMVACGSASYAALAGTYLFSRIAKRHINYSVGSEFKYLEDYITPKTLVIPISQSGESIDVIEPVTSAKKRGATISAIVNVLGSTLYRVSDHKILLGAGIEKSVVATKSLTAMLAVLILSAYTLAQKQKEGEDILIKSAKNLKSILQTKYLEKIIALTEELKKKEHIYIIGRGLSYATALEATLKLKEASYTHAEGFAGGELKHGVIALIDKGTPCIVFAPNDETYEDVISNAQEIKARGGLIIGIGPKNNKIFDKFLETDDVKDATIIPQVVISQLLAYYLALKKGVEDPDKPRNLAKSVTVK